MCDQDRISPYNINTMYNPKPISQESEYVYLVYQSQSYFTYDYSFLADRKEYWGCAM